LFFLYIFLYKNIQILFTKNKFKKYNDEIKKYLYILSNIRDGLAIIDGGKNILFVNDAFNKNIRSVKILSNIKEFDALTRNLELNSLIDKVVSDINFKFIEKKISYYDRAEEKIISCIVLKIGSSNEYAVITRDITYLQKIENSRAAFIQNISHELKTPITAIIGFTETLKNGAIDNPDVRIKFIDIIDHHAKRLNYLIDDLITLTNIETEKSRVKYERIHIKTDIDNSLALFEKEIKEKKLTVINNISDISFVSDPVKINQIITNLIQNAVKYTDKGGTIKLEGYIADSQTAGNFILSEEGASVLWDNSPFREGSGKFFFFSIEDDGKGVNYTNLLRLGERFFRVDSSHNNAHKGTGLGLAIVKHTLKLLQGKAIIKSSLGNGFIFSFIIPEAKKNFKQN
ncbi:MAG: ATP-binding protein, partial [Deltaproteobacteria bacterium]|nr:ATP-binding protein [Deltaproteobacteria bacterium]